MELPDDLFTPITDFISDEHVPTSTNLDKLTDNNDFAMSPITRTLIEMENFVKDNDNAIEEAINQPSVHDSFKQLKIDTTDTTDNGNNSKLPDSPRPKKRSINFICNQHDYERTGEGHISSKCRVAIRRYHDEHNNVKFVYSPDVDLPKNEVKSTQCQTDIMDPAILITLPKSHKIELTLKHNKYVYENRIEKHNEERYTVSYAAKFRPDGFSKKFGTFPRHTDYHTFKPLMHLNDETNNAYSSSMPDRRSYSMPKQLPHHYYASSYVFHLDANTQPQLKELAKSSNMNFHYDDYHKTNASFHITFRMFIPNPIESKPYIRNSIEEDIDEKRRIQMAAEDLQSCFAEVNDNLNKAPMTLQLKHRKYISPYVMIFPQKLKWPFNDDLYIRHIDPVKQYMTLESPEHPGRPILAPIEAVQCADDYVIAASYREYDERNHSETPLHEYQNLDLTAADEYRFHQLTQLKTSDLIKTVMLYEKTLKQFTTNVKDTDDPMSTLKYLMKEQIARLEVDQRLKNFEETMKRNNVTLEKIPELLMEHNYLMNYYEKSKEHFEKILLVAYKAQNIVKKCTKLIQFGDAAFPEFANKTTSDELLDVLTEERFADLVEAYKYRESQLMYLQEKATDFKFKWYDLNFITKCLKFHDYKNPDRIGTGNQAAAPESEHYMQYMQRQILLEEEEGEIPQSRPTGSQLARFLYYQPEFSYAPDCSQNHTFGEGMFN